MSQGGFRTGNTKKPKVQQSGKTRNHQRGWPDVPAFLGPKLALGAFPVEARAVPGGELRCSAPNPALCAGPVSH